MGILVLLVGLAAFVCHILIVVKMFKNAGVLHGILGFICFIYALIWGWMNANKYGIRNLVLAYTALLILYFVLAFAFGGFSYSYGVPGTPVTP